MASSSFSAGTSMDVHQTQNTAPVLEFRCLWTQDLRRKQKRWQDGRLKFHTFNKRVMVYDERSNFVGDTHWREDTAFDEGEQLELERGGILVEVGEWVGKRDQDLFELVDKRVKERQERAAAKTAASSPSRPHASLIQTSQATPGPLQHKPLNALLTTTGHYGRAVIPQTSPFEEKQRSINGNQDGAENGRPAKRRKPNEDAPSKSGYAQNLMGATLSLASSKPPRTATIRYESVRARPNVRETPTPAIDLTGDNDEDVERHIGASRASVTKDQVSGDRRGKDQRRLKRSPARSGYASNLTGASLTLSRPEDLSARYSNKNLLTRPIQRNQNCSSSEPEEDSLIDIESVVRKLTAVTKRSKESNRKVVLSPKRNLTSDHGSSSPTLADDTTPITKLSKSSIRKQVKPRKEALAFEHRSSSPIIAVVPTSKPTKIAQRPPIQKSSAAAPTPEQSASVLRIKVRPPRKMMMLMDRPSSRLSATVVSSRTSRHSPKPHQNANSASNEVVLSQATKHLDAFCQRQEEFIQARLNGKRPTFDLEDLLSSPEDSGINHQTIDLLLSRKILSVGNKTVIEPNKSTSASQDVRTAAQIERSCPKTELDSGDVLNSQPKKSANLFSGGATKGTCDDEEACPRAKNPSSDSNAISKREISTSPGPVLQNESITVALTVAPTNPDFTFATQEKEEQTVTKVSQASPRMSKLPEHFSSAVQAATDHFRAMMKSSATPKIQLADATSATPGENDQIEHTPSVRLPQQKEQTASSEVAVKPSPRSSVIGEVLNIESELSMAGPVRAKSLDKSSEKAVAPVLAANGKLDAPRARLLNPATRGKSLQTIAANTIDSLAPAFSLMPPPLQPQRITTRPQRSLDRNVVAEERPSPGGYVGKRTVTGPWSRESYDLFGSWLPPGTEQEASPTLRRQTTASQ
jgi:Protein of unknown function (DUF2439)